MSNREKTINYLSSIYGMDRRIKNKLTEIYQLRSLATSVSIKPNDMNVQTSKSKDKMGSIVAKIVDLENQVNDYIDELLEYKKEIITQIESFDERGTEELYNVLFLRYVADKSWNDISDDIGYSKRHVIRLNDAALLQFEKRFGHEYL